jgi:hypothetical protein
MVPVLDDALKVSAVIDSCVTLDHFDVAENMLNNFSKKYIMGSDPYDRYYVTSIIVKFRRTIMSNRQKLLRGV